MTKMRISIGWTFIGFNLCCIAAEGILPSKTSLQQGEIRVPVQKVISEAELNQMKSATAEPKENNNGEEEFVTLVHEEEIIQQQEKETFFESNDVDGDCDMRHKDVAFLTEPDAALDDAPTGDAYSGEGDLEEATLGSNVPGNNLGQFGDESGKNDVDADDDEPNQGQNLVEADTVGSKDTVSVVEDLESNARRVGDVGRVEREAVLRTRMGRNGEWLRVAEWVHYPELH